MKRVLLALVDLAREQLARVELAVQGSGTAVKEGSPYRYKFWIDPVTMRRVDPEEEEVRIPPTHLRGYGEIKTDPPGEVLTEGDRIRVKGGGPWSGWTGEVDRVSTYGTLRVRFDHDGIRRYVTPENAEREFPVGCKVRVNSPNLKLLHGHTGRVREHLPNRWIQVDGCSYQPSELERLD